MSLLGDWSDPSERSLWLWLLSEKCLPAVELLLRRDVLVVVVVELWCLVPQSTTTTKNKKQERGQKGFLQSYEMPPRAGDSTHCTEHTTSGWWGWWWYDDDDEWKYSFYYFTAAAKKKKKREKETCERNEYRFAINFKCCSVPSAFFQ